MYDNEWLGTRYELRALVVTKHIGDGYAWRCTDCHKSNRGHDLGDALSRAEEHEKECSVRLERDAKELAERQGARAEWVALRPLPPPKDESEKR